MTNNPHSHNHTAKLHVTNGNNQRSVKYVSPFHHNTGNHTKTINYLHTMEKRYSIYAFKKGSEIVYIGMTFQPFTRLRQHVARSKRRNSPKDIWIRKHKPEMIILHEGLTEDQAHETERKLLSEYNPIYNVLTYTRQPKRKQAVIHAEPQSELTSYFHAFYQHYLPELFPPT